MEEYDEGSQIPDIVMDVGSKKGFMEKTLDDKAIDAMAKKLVDDIYNTEHMVFLYPIIVEAFTKAYDLGRSEQCRRMEG